MHILTELTFDGRCEEAFRFYERTLGGRIVALFKYANSPMSGDVPPEWQDKIMHATLEIGESQFTGDDQPPPRYQQPKGIQLMINLDDPAEAERIFQALSGGGTVTVPMQKTFWALRFGACVDRFGIPWSINCEDLQQEAGASESTPDA
jgi:PhnB protein